MDSGSWLKGLSVEVEDPCCLGDHSLVCPCVRWLCQLVTHSEHQASAVWQWGQERGFGAPGSEWCLFHRETGTSTTMRSVPSNLT